jgi:ribosomal protein S12 methylthiotransferase
MPDQVGAKTAELRRDTLMQLQQGISLEKNMLLVGTIQDVIVDGLEDDGWVEDSPDENDSEEKNVYVGRTRADAPEIDGTVIFSAPAGVNDIIGTIVRVRITDAFDYDLVGEIE